jgi:hypothetical protein
MSGFDLSAVMPDVGHDPSQGSKVPGGSTTTGALDLAGTAVGIPGAGELAGSLSGLFGGGHGNPDSAFSVGHQKIRNTKLLDAKRYDDTDRSSELFFSTGRGVAEKARYKPGQPWNLPNGVKNYSAVSHWGHQTMARLTDAQIIALAPGKYVPQSGAQSSTFDSLVNAGKQVYTASQSLNDPTIHAIPNTPNNPMADYANSPAFSVSPTFLVIGGVLLILILVLFLVL